MRWPSPDNPVAYRALRFDTDASTADAWSDALMHAGALSVDLADPQAHSVDESPIYGEPDMEFQSAWPVTRITAMFDHDVDLDHAGAEASAVIGAPLPAHERLEIHDQDWVRATQAQFEPIRIVEGLWVVPSWSEPIDPAALNLRLDPGLAFGTGSHPTTRLCLAWLAQADLRRRSVLDYGCGSGILAIAAAKLGARDVVGTDIDPNAISAAAENARRNGVGVRWAMPEALMPARFDVVVANILANPLILLAPALAERVNAGGALVLSGVLEWQAGDVVAAYAPWFRIDVWQREDGWVALAGERSRARAAER